MPIHNNPNTNPNPNQDVSPQRTTMIPIVIGLIIALVIGVIGYTFFFSDSSTTQPINRSEDNTLSAPNSTYPNDTNERVEASDRNLSSRPPQNPNTNNKPFEAEK